MNFNTVMPTQSQKGATCMGLELKEPNCSASPIITLFYDTDDCFLNKL